MVKNMNPRTGLDEVGSPPPNTKLVLTVPQSVVHAFNIDQKYKSKTKSDSGHSGVTRQNTFWSQVGESVEVCVHQTFTHLSQTALSMLGGFQETKNTNQKPYPTEEI